MRWFKKHALIRGRDRPNSPPALSTANVPMINEIPSTPQEEEEAVVIATSSGNHCKACNKNRCIGAARSCLVSLSLSLSLLLPQIPSHLHQWRMIGLARCAPLKINSPPHSVRCVEHQKVPIWEPQETCQVDLHLLVIPPRHTIALS